MNVYVLKSGISTAAVQREQAKEKEQIRYDKNKKVYASIKRKV